MVRVLILALSSYSIGELHNAIYFGRQLQESGIEVHFITAAGMLAYAETAGFPARCWHEELKTNRQVLAETIRELQPAALFVADYYLLDMEKPVIELDWVLEPGLPAATFDSMGWSRAERVLENQAYRSLPEVEVLGNKVAFQTRIRAVPEAMKVIRHCPTNNPRRQETGIINVKLFTRPLGAPPATRTVIRQKYGCGDQDRLVLCAKAAWAYLITYIQRYQQGASTKKLKYEEVFQEVLQLYLQGSDLKVRFLGVSPQKVFAAPAEDGNNVSFISLPFLNMPDFEALLFSVDLFLTDNLVGCSLAKAAWAGVPGLALANSVRIGSREPLALAAPFTLRPDAEALLRSWEQVAPGSVYPFHTYPSGWIEELQPLEEGNPLLATFATGEMFDLEKTGQLLRDLLTGGRELSDLAAAQAAYRAEVDELPGAVEAFQWVLGS